MTRVLEELADATGLPQVLVMNNGPEFTSKAKLCWAQERGAKPHFIDPGKPTQDAYIKSFNGNSWDECLNQHWFNNLQEAGRMIEERGKITTARALIIRGRILAGRSKPLGLSGMGRQHTG